MARLNRPSMAHPEPPAKRLSTPAGQRLSVIMENKQADKNLKDTKLIGAPIPPVEAHPATRGQAFETWSDGSNNSLHGEKLAALRQNRHIASRGGWKRLAAITTGILLVIIAIVVGVVVGIRNKSSNNSSDASSSTSQSPSGSQDPTAVQSPGTQPTNAAETSSADSPVGTWTAMVYLNNVLTDCTENPATWTCYPYKTYQVNQAQSAAPFEYVISQKGDGYQISSSGSISQIYFSKAALTKENDGTDDEHWRFQTFVDKTVQTSISLTDDGNLSSCIFNDTTYTGYLYTRAARDFPVDDDTAAYPLWPYKARVEQIASGAEDVPTCYRLTNGVPGGAPITTGLAAQDASRSCSCLWRS